jgi:hypothetical protein
MAKVAFNRKKTVQLEIELKLNEKPLECYIWSITLYDAETRRFRKVNQKEMGLFELLRMEKISWTDRAENEVLHRIKEKRSVLRIIQKRNDNWIRHTLRGDCQ